MLVSNKYEKLTELFYNEIITKIEWTKTKNAENFIAKTAMWHRNRFQWHVTVIKEGRT